MEISWARFQGAFELAQGRTTALGGNRQQNSQHGSRPCAVTQSYKAIGSEVTGKKEQL